MNKLPNWSGVFAILGIFSISLSLVVLGLLSHRIGRVTRAGRYYIGLFVAAGLVFSGAFVRLFGLSDQLATISILHNNIVYVLLYNGLPAIGLTLGVVVAWRYWSWLLAERG